MAKNTKASTFAPAGYEVKTGASDFFKPKAGANKFRILTDSVVVLEGWKDNKPFRRDLELGIKDHEVDEDEKSGKPKINEIMAFYIYSYDEDKIMIASFSQATIKKEILALANDEEWGHPSGYDITIKKTGDGFQSRYTVTPSPKKALAKTVQAVVDEAEASFDLDKALTIERDF